MKKTTPTHLIKSNHRKLRTNNGKEKILEVAREKGHITYRRNMIQISCQKQWKQEDSGETSLRY